MTKSTAADTLDLSVSRYIAAPPEKVWKIMTERVTEWWCPRPWVTEIIEQDWRPGGRFAMIMRGPNGEESPIEGIFLEVTPGRRFVTTVAVTSDWRPHGPFMIGFWEIVTEGSGTRYTAYARHWTAEAKKQHEEMGFTSGWAACADQLAELAEAK